MSSTNSRWLWSICSQVLPVLVSVPFVGFLARHLSPADLSFYFIAQTALTILPVLDFGSTTSILLLSSRGNCSARTFEPIISKLLWPLTALQLGVGATAYFLYRSSLHASESESQVSYLVCSIHAAAILQTFFNLRCSVLEGLAQYSLLIRLRTISSVFFVTCPAAFFILHASLASVIFGMFAARAISTIYLLYEWRNFPSKPYEQVKMGIISMITTGRKNFCINIMGLMFSFSDRIILSQTKTGLDSAAYLAVLDVSGKILFFPVALSRYIVPGIASQKLSERDMTVRSIWMIGAFALGCLSFWYLSEKSFKVWLGPALGIQAGLYFSSCVIGIISNGIAQFPFSYLQATGMTKPVVIFHGIILVPYIILLLVMFEYKGFSGLLVAWSIRCFVDCAGMLLIAKSRLRNTE